MTLLMEFKWYRYLKTDFQWENIACEPSLATRIKANNIATKSQEPQDRTKNTFMSNPN